MSDVYVRQTASAHVSTMPEHADVDIFGWTIHLTTTLLIINKQKIRSLLRHKSKLMVC